MTIAKMYTHTQKSLLPGYFYFHNSFPIVLDPCGRHLKYSVTTKDLRDLTWIKPTKNVFFLRLQLDLVALSTRI
jgi:hypothetical protein